MGQRLSSLTHPNPSNHGPPDPASDSVSFTGAVPPTGVGTKLHEFFFLFPPLAFGFLTLNSIASIRRSIHDPWTVAFIAGSYADLVLLYHCLRLAERVAPGDDRRRCWLKAAVWLLASLLIVMFAFRVVSSMPPALVVLVWAMSAGTIASSFFALFLYDDAPEKPDTVAWKNADVYEKC